MPEETSILLHVPMEALLQRLTILNGYLYLLAHQLEQFRNSRDPEYGGLAIVRLIIPDLPTPTTQEYLNYVHGGISQKEGEQFIQASHEFVKHWSSWTIAQSYEAFETFLRDISAHLFHKQRPQKPIGTLRQIPIDVENVDAWKDYFRDRSWDPQKILKLLRLVEPSIENIEKQNYVQVDLQQWFLLYTPVRHAIIHSNSQVLRRDIQASNNTINQLLPIAFPGSWDSDVYTIISSEQSAAEIIQLTGAYAFLIYKQLCLHADVPLLVDIIK